MICSVHGYLRSCTEQNTLNMQYIELNKNLHTYNIRLLSD